ncbi:MAG: hemerythrin domain-containing protein [Acidimicrobiia bacterium]|nr:hemerythrin domain-containing protein [Acidimicrobiia bacterium]
MSASADSTGTADGNEDLIAAIRRDHRQIERQFDSIEMATDLQARDDAFRELVRTLVAHETAEQVIVHPLTRRRSEEVAEARLAEEKEGEVLLALLEELGVGSDDFEIQLARLRRDVLEHAGREERDEHPLIEREVDAERLDRLGDAFRTAERAAPTHAHPHSPRSATGNVVAGPFMAIVDRVRDAAQRALGSSS